MISIRPSLYSELQEITDMGNQSHVLNFLSKKTLKTHEKDFVKDHIIYLSVISASNELAGYIILCRKKHSKSVQLKRILINEKHLGVGQESIATTEKYCLKILKANHLWLDVYDSNSRAKHVYEKLGYKLFKENIQHSKTVLFYEKRL